VHAQEFDGGVDRGSVRPLEVDVGVLAADRGGGAIGDGTLVDLEALVEAEVRRHPAVANDPARAKAGILEDLGGHDRRFRQGAVVAHDAGAIGVEAGPERRHRALGPRRLGQVPFEADPPRGEVVEAGAGVPFVAVAAQPMSAQRVDQDEEHADVVALGECLDLVRSADRTGVAQPDGKDPSEEEGEHQEGGEKPGPAGLENPGLHEGAAY
jgi:hypothetical protein